MRSRGYLLLFIFAVSSLALPAVTHASIPFFGPIIPDAVNRCAAGWGAVITVINNIIELLITLAIVFVAPITIAYAGFLLVTGQGNAGSITKARGIILNTVIGIVIAMGAWLIVDAVMAVLYNQNASVPGTSTTLGVWSQIVTSGGQPFCLIQAASLSNLNQTNLSVSGVTANGNGVYVSGKAGALCGSSACSPSFLQSVGFTPTQANVMSCIALTENGGNATGCNGNACGTFQIMLTANPLVGQACGGTLNCPSLCKSKNGGAVQGESSCQPCVQAANNATCNAQTAQYLYSKSGYTPWTVGNSNSATCIQQYGGS